MMSPSNRELVEFYIRYKLSQKNYPISLLLPDPARIQPEDNNAASTRLTLASSPPEDHLEAVKAALLDSTNEFDARFTQTFISLPSQLHVTPITSYNSFESVMDQVFENGIHWGRIVSLFVLGGVMCVECVEKNMGHLVPLIADWMTVYLDENISLWIRSQGGWGHFAQTFGQNPAAKARRSWKSLTWLTVGTGLLTGALIVVLIAIQQ
ncbi:bcl-2-like protein 1 [Eucyclogobius newberryi]|uniref:bcl-2-like protein 1 n=1 Tax=Eucyclogobius newberryi TaxID=166745 RepID=UPI003B5B787B